MEADVPASPYCHCVILERHGSNRLIAEVRGASRTCRPIQIDLHSPAHRFEQALAEGVGPFVKRILLVIYRVGYMRNHADRNASGDGECEKRC